LFGVWRLAFCAFSICIENQKTNGILDSEFWMTNSLNLLWGRVGDGVFPDKNTRIRDFFLTQRHEGAKAQRFI
jgi:hypothetical protein